MTIEKLDPATPDLTKQNVARIAELFPECVAEGPEGTAADHGEPAIDFDLLRQALSDHLVEGPQERYRLDWPGKRRALLAANAPIDKTLRPMRDDSVDFDTTRNLFIEGDNLDALKLLQETYLGKVKMIYIDPPYNTGKDFIYKDNFAQSRESYEAGSGQRDEDGGRLVANPETSGRYHSDWLSMIYPRLKLARNLLREDGLIVISIDGGELASLQKIVAEVFGEGNWVGEYPVVSNLKGNQDDFGFAGVHEYIVVAAKDKALLRLSPLPVDESDLGADWSQDEHGLFKRADTLRRTGADASRLRRPKGYFPVFIDAAGQVYASLDDAPRDDGDTILYPVNDEGEELSWSWGRQKIIDEPHNLVVVAGRNGKPNIYKKQRPALGDVVGSKMKSVLYDPSYSSSTATTYAKNLMGGKVFDNPKPVPLLRDLIEATGDEDGLVLDFFAGSAAMAEAVLSRNAGGGRAQRFIMVQIGEATDPDSEAAKSGFETIAQLSRERIRRAGRKLAEQGAGRAGDLDTGFRAFRIDAGNFEDVRVSPAQATQAALAGMISHIKDDRSEEDLLFGALLRWGVDITLPVAKRELLGRTLWLVDPPAEGEEGAALIACFARPSGGKGGIDVALADALAQMKPLRVLFRDDGFAGDAAKENVASRLKQRSPDTSVRVL
ncbi:MAG TPA: site-specific DNA-methyltransferase [Allosphingosinicella sp.]|nr:site-specific DNA-methyltransferase [Allosphingosinicella sp.]